MAREVDENGWNPCQERRQSGADAAAAAVPVLWQQPSIGGGVGVDDHEGEGGAHDDLTVHSVDCFCVISGSSRFQLPSGLSFGCFLFGVKIQLFSPTLSFLHTR